MNFNYDHEIPKDSGGPVRGGSPSGFRPVAAAGTAILSRAPNSKQAARIRSPEIVIALSYLGHPLPLLDAFMLEALIQASVSAAFVVPGASIE